MYNTIPCQRKKNRDFRCFLVIMWSAASPQYTEHCAACSNQTQPAHVYQNADSSLRKQEDLTQCCFNIGPGPLVGGGAILKQHWVKSSCLLGSTQVSVYTHPCPSIIFSPADQGTTARHARQPANHKLTTILEIESGGHMTSPICKF